jgi:HK97 family phage portal protein
MGILANKLGIQNWSLEDPSQPLLPYSALFESLGLGRSDAGVMVNEKQAMRLSTMFACIKVISEDLSSLPLSIWQRMPDDSVRDAREHKLYPLLHDQPNDNMTSVTFRAVLIASVLAWGNAFALIRRDKASRARSLQPLAPDKTSAVFTNGKLGFATTQTEDGQPRYIAAEDMLHVIGTSFDGITGLSPVQTCKNAFGLSIAAEKFGAQFFGNGSRATGVVSHPAQLNAEAYANLKKSIREWATGEDALRPIVLEEGMKWEQLSVNPNDAQFLETRQFQRAEIAALYRVPLHLLQDLQRSTNNNIEHQGIDYSKFCLKPLAVKIEQELNRKLLSNGPFFAEHDMNDLSRGDFASQTEGFMVLRNGGVYSANDVLRGMRQNPIPADEGGDVRIVQMANIPLDSLVDWKPGQTAQPGKAAAETSKTDSDGGNPVARAFQRLFRDAVGRVSKREQPDEQFVYRAFQPAVAAMAEAIIAQKLSFEQELFVTTYTRALCSRLPEGMALDEAAKTITADAYAALSGGLNQ